MIPSEELLRERMSAFPSQAFTRSFDRLGKEDLTGNPQPDGIQTHGGGARIDDWRCEPSRAMKEYRSLLKRMQLFRGNEAMHS